MAGAPALALLPLILVLRVALGGTFVAAATNSYSNGGGSQLGGLGSEAAAGGPPRPHPARPNQLRLALGDGGGELVVLWSTEGPTNDSCVQLEPVATDAAAGPEGPSWGLARPLLLRSSSSLDEDTAPLRPEAAGEAATSSQLLPAVEGSTTVCGGRSAAFVEPSTQLTTQYLHEVALAGLEPGQQYRYRVGSTTEVPEAEGWSDWTALTAPRAARQLSAAQPAGLLVVGDMGFANARTLPDLVADAQGGEYDAVLHVGDIGYDLDSLHGRRAAQFLQLVEPLASRLPYMVLPGNHEYHFNFSHYRQLFAMPNRALGEGLFYSFDLGPLHVMAYNTEAFLWPDCFGLDSMRLMYKWMERDLQAANRRRGQTPWILVAGHRPMYCVVARGTSCDWGWSREHEAGRLGIPSRCSPSHPLHCPPTGAGGGATFPVEELLHMYGVDVAVFGHSHCYERYLPVFNLSVAAGGPTWAGGEDIDAAVYLNPRATIHVTSGAGGNPEMRTGPLPPPGGPCNDSAPWCAVQSGFAPSVEQSSDFSYSRLRAFNATHLHWEQYSSTLGRAVDSWWVVQQRHGPFGAPDSSGSSRGGGARAEE